MIDLGSTNAISSAMAAKQINDLHLKAAVGGIGVLYSSYIFTHCQTSDMMLSVAYANPLA